MPTSPPRADACGTCRPFLYHCGSPHPSQGLRPELSMSNENTNWRIERDADGVAWLCFDKAGASTNVLSTAVMLELGEMLKQVAAQPPKALVIYSAKKNGFIAGADIKEIKDLRVQEEAFRM